MTLIDIPLLSEETILLFRLAIRILFGGTADEECDIDDIVLAVSAAIEGDLIDDTGDVID